MPKQRPLEDRINDLKESLDRLQVLKKIQDLQDQLPKGKKQRRR